MFVWVVDLVIVIDVKCNVCNGVEIMLLWVVGCYIFGYYVLGMG